MTTWIIKEEEIEDTLNQWVEGILKHVKGKDLVFSNDIHGTFYSPSKKYKIFRTAGFAFTPDIFKDESVSPFVNAVPFGFFFVPKGKISEKEPNLEDFLGNTTKELKDTTEELKNTTKKMKNTTK